MAGKHHIVAPLQRAFFRSLLTLVLIYVMAPGKSYAQDLEPGWKSWNMLGLNVKVTKQLTLKVGQMSSFNPQPFRFSFMQGTLQATYRLKDKRHYIGGGYNPIYFRRPNEGRNIFHRAYIKGIRKGKLLGFKTKHTVNIQYYFPRVQKYMVRGVYQFKWYYDNKWMPWKGTPYMSHDFMYYLGGKPIIYYDEFDGVSAFQSPNGLHRWRLTLGCYFKPTDFLSVNVFYKTQREFNTGLFPNRELNVTREGSSNVTYAFNNYWVWGASFSFTLRPYRNRD